MASYAGQLKQFVTTTYEFDQQLGELTRELIDIKDTVPPDYSSQIASALAYLGAMHKSLASARDSINKIFLMQQGVKEEVGSIEEAYTSLLIELGYNTADREGNWYNHPAGHQLKTEGGLGLKTKWTYFPPRMMGEVTKGVGFLKLREHLQQIHKRDVQEGVLDGGIARAQEKLGTSYRDFLVRQTEVMPVERFQVWENGQQHPALLARDPDTGEWRCYTCEANFRADAPYDPHIEIVKRWIWKGRPAVPNAVPIE